MRRLQIRHIPDAFDLCNAVVGDPRQSRDDLKQRDNKQLGDEIRMNTHFVLTNGKK